MPVFWETDFPRSQLLASVCLCLGPLQRRRKNVLLKSVLLCGDKVRCLPLACLQLPCKCGGLRDLRTLECATHCHGPGSGPGPSCWHEWACRWHHSEVAVLGPGMRANRGTLPTVKSPLSSFEIFLNRRNFPVENAPLHNRISSWAQLYCLWLPGSIPTGMWKLEMASIITVFSERSIFFSYVGQKPGL